MQKHLFGVYQRGLLIGAVLLSFVLVQITLAQDLSNGCEQVNTIPDPLAGAGGFNQEFFEGETISFTVNTTVDPIRLTFSFRGEIVADTGLIFAPAEVTLSYTFPADTSGDFGWTFQISDLGMGGTIDTTTNCEFTGMAGGTDETVTLTEQPPDNRLNWRGGDLQAVLYPATDHEGNSALDLYCVFDNEGQFVFRITEEFVEAWDDSLPQEVPLAEAPECNAAFYELDTGEFQVNITLDAGKYFEVICEDLTCATRTIRFTDPALLFGDF